MAKITNTHTFKRLRNRYRLVIMNDDTYEEVATFKLSRRSVYIAMSTVFVLLVGLTIAVVYFTNLKYLVPGYGKQSSLQELRMLKIRADSLEKAVVIKQHYLEGIQRVLRGDTSAMPKDTMVLNVPVMDSVSTD